MKNRIRAMTLVSLLLYLLPVAAQQRGGPDNCPDPASTLLWHIPGIDSNVYLFGSIHVGKADFYPLHEKIETTYRHAGHIVFEVDPRVAASPEIAIQIQSRGILPEGKSLGDVLSPGVLNELVMRLTRLGLPANSFMNFQPWYLTLVLTNIQTASLGYFPTHGIEAYLIGQRPVDADILELESIQTQINFLEELNGESYLEYTLMEFEDAEERINEMIQAWECADQEKLEEIIFSTDEEIDELPEMENLMEKLFFDRNVIMAEKIMSYLETGSGDYFIVVGAGHLIGKRSVLDLLDDRYRVENIRLY